MKLTLAKEQADMIEGFLTEAFRRGITKNEFISALQNGYEVEPEYSKGDYVVWHGLVVNIKHPQTNDHKDDGRCYFTLERIDGSTYGNITRDKIRHATPSEIAEEKERRWWKKHGRDVNEYKSADVIRIENGIGLYEVVDNYDNKRLTVTSDFANTEFAIYVDEAKLVAPVENRLDLEQEK